LAKELFQISFLGVIVWSTIVRSLTQCAARQTVTNFAVSTSVHMGRTPLCGRPHAVYMKYTPLS